MQNNEYFEGRKFKQFVNNAYTCKRLTTAAAVEMGI